MTDTTKERAAWLADKIVALGDYAKEAAALLRDWPDQPPYPGLWFHKNDGTIRAPTTRDI